METRTVKFRKLMLGASENEMTRDERIEFAEMILRRDVESWKSLTEPEIERLLDAFEGHHLLTHLRTSR
jgi:hypothetical protein